VALVAGAIVPHAPALGLNTGPARIRTSAELIRAAVKSLPLDDCDALVMLSPHGRASGVYSGVMGSLDAFGVRAPSVASPTELAVAEELAREWERPFLEPPLDHGITGALLVMGWMGDRPVVAATLAGTTGPGAPGQVAGVIEEAIGLADAVISISNARRIGFVASAHTSAALSPSAPLLDRPEGHALDEEVLAALRHDAGGMADIEPGLWRAAGACGAGPLTVFAKIFSGRRAEVLAYEAPAGVGYLVAQAAV